MNQTEFLDELEKHLTSKEYDRMCDILVKMLEKGDDADISEDDLYFYIDWTINKNILYNPNVVVPGDRPADEVWTAKLTREYNELGEKAHSELKNSEKIRMALIENFFNREQDKKEKIETDAQKYVQSMRDTIKFKKMYVNPILMIFMGGLTFTFLLTFLFALSVTSFVGLAISVIYFRYYHIMKKEVDVAEESIERFNMLSHRDKYTTIYDINNRYRNKYLGW